MTTDTSNTTTTTMCRIPWHDGTTRELPVGTRCEDQVEDGDR